MQDLSDNITAIVLTYNEEIHLDRCLKSIRLITDKINIVDSFSTDNTAIIAKNNQANFYQNKWKNSYANQFNWALENTNISTDWIFRIDADEYLTSELAKYLLQNFQDIESKYSGIYINRQITFLGKMIRYGGKRDESHLKIFRKGVGRCEERWMDEHIVLSSGNELKINKSIIDDNQRNLTWWINKHNNYATREAIDILNTKYNLIHEQNQIKSSLIGNQAERKRALKIIYSNMPLFLRPILYFLFRYFFKFGFLDGKVGLVYCVLHAFWYRFIVDSKIYEASKKCSNNIEYISYFQEEFGIEINKISNN